MGRIYTRVKWFKSVCILCCCLVSAKLKEYSDWLGDNATMPNAAGWVNLDLVCRSQYSGVGET